MSGLFSVEYNCFGCGFVQQQFLNCPDTKTPGRKGKSRGYCLGNILKKGRIDMLYYLILAILKEAFKNIILQTFLFFSAPRLSLHIKLFFEFFQ